MPDCFVDNKGAIYNPILFGISPEEFLKLEPNKWYVCTDGTKVRVGNSDKEEERMRKEIKHINGRNYE